MADSPAADVKSLFALIRPGRAEAPLVVSSDVLVLMLRLLGVLRALAARSDGGPAPGPGEIAASLVDLERRITALLAGVDSLLDR